MSNTNIPANVAATPNAFNRKAPIAATNTTPDTFNVFGPLQALITGETWIGDTGYNLMVVPSPISENGFIVMISQLFETHTFEAVPAGVPNRTLANGTERVGAVKYSQTVAENVSKNILHEETGMWLNQTTGDPMTPPDFGLGPVHGMLDGQAAISFITGNTASSNYVVRSGTVPHGNTFQAAGLWSPFPSPQPSGDVMPYINASNYPLVNGALSFLPTYADGTSDQALQDAYITELKNALTLIGLGTDDATVQSFINPIVFLNKYANNIDSVVSMPVTTDNSGAVINLPFETAVAGPTKFVSTFMIETINDPNGMKLNPTTDQVPQFYQLQYLTSIPLKFPSGFAGGSGRPVIFPHWNVNTLIAI